MSEPAQPTIQLLLFEEDELRTAFASSVAEFEHLRDTKPKKEGESFFIAAVAGDTLAGYVQMNSNQYSENIVFMEVRPAWRQKGISKSLREEAFRYAAEHTGAILLSPPTDMGKTCLIKQTPDLAKKFPTLHIGYEQFC